MSVRWISGMDLSNPTSLEADNAALTASWILYKLTAEKYPGISTDTDWYGVDSENFGATQWVSDGTGISHVGDRHITIYEVGDYFSKRLYLRSKPVVSVFSVATARGVLDPSQYQIANKAFLVRTNNSSWDFREGVTVTYTHGVLPPHAGINAAIRLGDELLKSVEDPDNCSLPDRVTSVSRQGLSYAILDPQDFLVQGRTGLYEVDLFIKAANPTNARKRPKVFSPDLPSGRRTQL